MRISALLGAMVALGLSTAGHAASISILSPGVFGPPSGSVATFDNVSAEAYGSTASYGSLYGSLLDGGASFSGSGVVMNNGGRDSLGLYATPFGDATNYMAVLGGGSEEIAYSGSKDSFGLYWGSVDTYNSLTFYSGDNLVATITGADLGPSVNPNGGQTDYASNAYVLITRLPQFDRVFASSSSNSFEFDNVIAGGTPELPSSVAAVPEPSTWAMLLLGFAGLGYVASRRRKAPISALA
jgi:PEP-CTERM motif